MTCFRDKLPLVAIFGEFVQPNLFDDLVQSKQVTLSMGEKPTNKSGLEESERIREIYETNVKVFYPKDYPADQLGNLVTTLKQRNLIHLYYEMGDRLIFQLDAQNSTTSRVKIPLLDRSMPEKRWMFRLNRKCKDSIGRTKQIGRYYNSFVGAEKKLQEHLVNHCNYYKIEPVLTLDSNEVSILIELDVNKVQELPLEYLRLLDPEAISPYDVETETETETETDDTIVKLPKPLAEITPAKEESVAQKLQHLVDQAYDIEASVPDRIKALQQIFRLDSEGDIVCQVCYWLVRLDKTPLEHVRELLDKTNESVNKKGAENKPGVLLAEAIHHMTKLLNRDVTRFYPKIEAWINYGQKQEPLANGERLMTFLLSCRSYYKNLYAEEKYDPVSVVETDKSSEIIKLPKVVSANTPCSFCKEPNAPYYYDYIASHACQKCHETDAKTTFNPGSEALSGND